MIEQTQIYGVVLPVHIAQRARVVAAIRGKSRSSLMRDLLLEYLEKADPAPTVPPLPSEAQPIPHKRKSAKEKLTA